VVEELLSGESRPAQLCRRHNISSSLLYHWKKQYSRGNPVSSTGPPRKPLSKTGLINWSAWWVSLPSRTSF
jgi:transposase-like protein